jgi:2-iminobutanoate/2-iminopropanoate deaminase
MDGERLAADRDLGEQAELCFGSIERVLAEAGATLADVVRITAYLTTLDDYAAYSEVRKRAFGEAFPASAAVQVAGLLGGALVEIDAVAFLRSQRESA